MRILVTGAAGFIGFHIAKGLLDQGKEVLGLDNLNDYYDPKLKSDRLEKLQQSSGFRFSRTDLSDQSAVESLFEREAFDRVVHLAAQAGVRYSINHPHLYTRSNVEGFLNILEGCRHQKVKHLVFASSSSIYGLNTAMPFSTGQNTDHPVSLYAATKKANELMAHSYSFLYGLPVTGLRFFTVYGPWGRPDMATFSFTRAVFEQKPIPVYNAGKMKRDFIYVDDLVDGVLRVIERIPEPDPEFNPVLPNPATSTAPYRLYNIGNNTPIDLLTLVQAIEKAVGQKAVLELMPMQPGDLLKTYADVSPLAELVDFRPTTSIEEGIARFVDWYRDYYGVTSPPPKARHC